MGLIEEIENNFCVKDLYEVFNVEKDASDAQIKKAYRNLSLKHHPDKFQNCDAKLIEIQTTKFQLLAKIHKILSDSEKRALYDEQGIILDEDSMDNADWLKYWRLLFPKITQLDISNYLNKYKNSEEEINDLKRIYVKCKGDMNLINEHMIGFEENRIRQMLNKLIDTGELDALPNFVNESQESIDKRKSKIKKERKEFDASEDDANEDLIKALTQNRERREGGVNSFLANLEAKYANPKKGRTQKRK